VWALLWVLLKVRSTAAVKVLALVASKDAAWAVGY
jgi:hypothetical protein